MSCCKQFLNFQGFFASYGEYHANSINKAIHMVFIPVLMATTIGMLNTLHSFAKVTILDYSVPVNISSVLLCFILLWYIYLDPLSGLVSSVLYTSSFFLMLHVQASWAYTSISFLQFCALLNLFSWIAQFIGHFVYEKRVPALFDNLFLTLVAPDFAVIEWMALLGYKEQEIGEATLVIEDRIKKFRESKKAD